MASFSKKLIPFIFFSSLFSKSLFADIAAPLNPSPPSLPPSPSRSNVTELNETPFRTSVAVIVAVLTTMLSVTFLLLLYAKHCKRGNVVSYNISDPNSVAAARKNSGIVRAVIESLPIFRFSSLRGQKEGLECTVCLTRFESAEVLRLLPKCKHAFHVDCVDTWLDAHSTCPLCRCLVDPEDILLIENEVKDNNTSNLQENYAHNNFKVDRDPEFSDVESGKGGGTAPEETNPRLGQISGRHSSAGERVTSWFQQKLGGVSATSLRRSLDISSWSKKSESTATVGCFDCPHRKDGLLLTTNDAAAAGGKTRMEQRVIVSSGLHQRWSDVQPSDLLYLRSEMILSYGRRLSSAVAPVSVNVKWREHEGVSGGGTSVINRRSVSEITGWNRFGSRESINRQRQAAGIVSDSNSRWLAWISSPS